MLSLICAPSGFGKTDHIWHEIENCLKTSEKSRLFVIVPEQESVRAEKALLDRFGNRINERLEILNFSRLANRVFREAGGITYKYVDTGGKDLLVSMVLEDFEEQLSAFSHLTEDEKFISTLRAEFDAFRLSGVSSEKLFALSRSVHDKEINGERLSCKLSEIANLYSLYEGLIKHSGVDAVDDLNRLCETLEEYDFFYDSYVFVDGFYDFTFPEYRILEHIISSSNQTFITLPLTQTDTENVFSKSRDAYLKLLEICREKESEYKTFWLDKRQKEQPEALVFLADRIIDGTRDFARVPSNGAITLTSCKTPYDECVYTAREILRLVKNGARFGDIAVCAGSISQYGTMLEDVFEKYGIRFLSGEKETLTGKALVNFILSALDVVESDFYLPRVKKYLENPFLPLDKKERYLLLNYITAWNISSSLWKSGKDWVMNPRGYVEKMSDEEKAELFEVNRARKTVLVPLLKLADAVKEKKVKNKVSAIWQFLCDSGAQNVLQERLDRFVQSGDNSRAEDEASVWNLTLSSLDRVAEAAGEREVSVERFIKYMRIVFTDTSFGRIPTALDEVEIGDIAFVRTGEIKHLFLIGFNEGTFPEVESETSVFSEYERQLLCRHDDYFNLNSQERILQNEVFHLLVAVSTPHKSLNLVYHTLSSDSSEARPSFFAALIESYVDLSLQEFDPLKAPPVCREEIEDWIMSNCDKESAEKIISQIKTQDPEFGEKLQKRIGTLNFSSETLSFENPPAMYEKGMNMTQARLDTYSRCPFSFFSNYMLRLRTHGKAEFRAAEMGSLVHKVLEDVLSHLAAEKKKLHEVPLDYIEKLARNSSQEYLEKTAPEISVKSRRFKYLTGRLTSFVVYVIENMREEFENSEFSPVLFEENMRDGGAIPPYSVSLPNGSRLVFYGCVDRVDMYEEDGVQYLRVVDYKTKIGGKKFDLNDVINGINLQLLVYLFAAWGDNDTQKAPAGIMYMPASRPSVVMNSMYETENEKDKRDKEMKRSGLFLMDEKILEAMEKGIEGRIIPVARKSKGGYTNESLLATLEQFGKLKRYTNKTFINLAAKLQKGEIPASPLTSSTLDPCKWCDFKPFCRYEGCGREYRNLDRPWEEIEENTKNPSV